MDDLIGQKLGRVYRLDERIATGGQAWVYRATRLDDVGSKYAVKVARPDIVAMHGTTERFQREIAIGARLRESRYIVHQRGSGALPRPFIVMDFCVHGTLQAQYPQTFPDGWQNGLQGETIPLDSFLPYVRQAAQALEYAHARGIVHRDVKPTNILIDEDDGDWYARLSDFGIASLEGDVLLTQAGAPMGSPLYAAPEQFFNPHNADDRADQYALAVVVYQLLTGVAPFPERAQRDVLARSPEVLARPPERPRNVAPSNVSPALEKVLLRALSVELRNRFESVAEFVWALDQTHSDPDLAIPSSHPTLPVRIRDEDNSYNAPTKADDLAQLPDGETDTIAWWDKTWREWKRVRAKGFGPRDRALVGLAAAPIMGLLSMPFTYGVTFPFGHYWLSIVVAIAALVGVPSFLKERF